MVPVKKCFTEFVKVTRDPKTNTSQVIGYCIDIFQVVIEKLPYAVAYNLTPFTLPNGSGSDDYNELIDQVFYQVK